MVILHIFYVQFVLTHLSSLSTIRSNRTAGYRRRPNTSWKIRSPKGGTLQTSSFPDFVPLPPVQTRRRRPMAARSTGTWPPPPPPTATRSRVGCTTLKVKARPSFILSLSLSVPCCIYIHVFPFYMSTYKPKSKYVLAQFFGCKINPRKGFENERWC